MKEFFCTLKDAFLLTFKSSKLYTFIRLFSDIVSLGAMLGTAYISKIIIDKIVELKGSQDISVLIMLIMFMISFQIISVVNEKINVYCTSIHRDIITNKITKQLMDVTLKNDIAFFDSEEYYNSFAVVKDGTYQLPDLVWNVISFVTSGVSVICTLLLFSQVNVLMGVFIILAAIPIALSERDYAKSVYMYEVSHMDEQRKMGYVNSLAESKGFAQEVRLYNLSAAIKDKFMSIWNPYFQTKRKLVRQKTIKNTFFSAFPNVIIGIVLVYLTIGITQNKYTVGDFSFYASIASQIVAYMFAFINGATDIYEKKLIINNINEFGKYQNTVIDNGTRTFEGNEMKIEFRNVVFRYPNTEFNALDDISFVIENGEHFALVGVNGAGKSTIIKLLLRLYDVTSGEILINDHNIKEYSIQELRQNIGTLFQQFSTLALTARDNIDPESMHMEIDPEKDQKIIEALKYAQGEDILEHLGDGLDTYISKVFSDDGVELSGGQQQKLAIARTFYRNASLIILDEPSAALDPEAEHKLFEILEKLTENKTALFTSHRFSNLIYADKIAVIEYGKLLECGTHSELMKNKARYTQLFNYQANKFLMDDDNIV